MSCLNWLSNGLGGQSMFLLALAAQRRIPATLSITADTGSENDRVCSDGQRMTAHEFFALHVQPFAKKHGIEAILVRTLDENDQPLPPLGAVLEETVLRARENSEISFEQIVRGISVPLFTNDKSRGRLRQSCTDKWKIRAINQEARRRGGKLLRNAIGFHAGEAHRIKARYLKDDNGFSVYKAQYTRKGVTRDIKWLEHYYPLIDLKLNREAIKQELERMGLCYLVTTECDFCPHQDLARWEMHTPQVLEGIEKLESAWGGKLFFTSKRIPLRKAIAEMRAEKDDNQELPGFGCENGAYCGIA